MANYTNRSKFIYSNYDEIQTGINNGTLDAFDIVYTKDTHENIIIAPDYSAISIKSKIYRFIDVASAEEFLNSASDTYEGQIVSIIFDGNYCAYIVNRRINGKFFVTPLSVYSGVVDYNTLGNRPINNLAGTIDKPIDIVCLDSGQYKIQGQYKIDETTYISANSNIFLIEHNDENTYIKKISANDITEYTIDINGQVTSSVVPTTEWLASQGYVTEQYVDLKIAALEYITKEEIEEYVSNIVLQNIDATVNTRIDQIINERFSTVTEREALDAFTDIFIKP